MGWLSSNWWLSPNCWLSSSWWLSSSNQYTSIGDYLSLPLCQLSRTGWTAKCVFALFHLPLKIPFCFLTNIFHLRNEKGIQGKCPAEKIKKSRGWGEMSRREIWVSVVNVLGRWQCQDLCTAQVYICEENDTKAAKNLTLSLCKQGLYVLKVSSRLWALFTIRSISH